jgi:hypothetical protein
VQRVAGPLRDPRHRAIIDAMVDWQGSVAFLESLTGEVPADSASAPNLPVAGSRN